MNIPALRFAIRTGHPRDSVVLFVPGHASNLPQKKQENSMIRKLSSGQYRLYSRKKDPKTGKRRNLGTFGTRKAAEAHERDVQYFKRQG